MDSRGGMSQGRGHFVCGAIFGVALGFAAGHLVIRARTPGLTLSIPAGLVPLPADLPPGAEGFPGPRARTAMNEPGGDGSPSGSIFERYPAGKPDQPAASRSVITADAFRKDDAGSAIPTLPQEPSPLPRVEALPIPPDSKPDEANSTELKTEDELRKLLEEELQSASPQQREVWKDALDGVPSGDAAEILRMWKSMGTGPAAGNPPLGLSPVPEPAGVSFSSPSPSNSPSSSSSPAGPASSPYYPSTASPSISPFPVPVQVSGPVGWSVPFPPTGEAFPGERLRVSHPRAWSRLRTDFAHAETPGYLRSIPELANADDGSDGPRFRIAAWRTDFAPGKPKQTGRMFDVCLTGPGFFLIKTGEGPALTRRGRLGLDEERRLGVRLGETIAPLSPEVVIPADSVGFEIAQDGSVRAADAGADSPGALLGRVEPVLVLDVGELQPVESLAGVFVATPKSGSPSKAPSKDWALLQFTLESSNVDPEVTGKWINRLEALAAEGALVSE